MNIAIYVSDGFNPKHGGIERVSSIETDIFRKLGHNVFYVSRHPEDTKEFHPIAEEVFLPMPHNDCAKENVDMFTEYVRSRSIDVILCQYPFEKGFTTLPYLVKKNTGVKLLYAVHQTPDYTSLSIEETSCPILPSEKRLSRQVRRIMRILFKKQKRKSHDKKMGDILREVYEMGDGVILLSKEFMPIYQRLTHVTSAEKFFAIPNPNTYEPEQIVDRDKENTLLFVGRLAIEKRPEKVLVLWKRIQYRFPDWNLKIVGAGELKEDLEILKRKMKLERCFIEGRQDPQPYYEKAKILLMTSDFEGFGMVLTEAMQNGTVPMAFNSFKALTDVIQDEKTGVIVNALDLDEYEKKLAELMSDEDKRKRMAQAAKEDVKKFSRERITEHWENLFRQLGF